MPQVDLKEVRPDGVRVSLATADLSRVPCIGEHVKIHDAYFEIVAVIHSHSTKYSTSTLARLASS